MLHQLSAKHIASKLRVEIISNSRYQLHIEDGSDRTNIGNILTLLPNSSSKSAQAVPEGYKISQHSLTDFVASLTQFKSSTPRLFIDCTSANSVAELYPTLLQSGISIVTPNKKAFSASAELYDQIQQARSPKALVYQESTVGAGLPIIGTLNDLVATGDEILKIEGVLSGTLSYIFNEFSKPGTGKAPAFSEVVKIAKAEGYTVSNLWFSTHALTGFLGTTPRG